jgi:acyl-coenzyme A synthetase/AMP-(fatty) acid ligase
VYQFSGVPIGHVVLKLLASLGVTHMIAVSTFLQLVSRNAELVRRAPLRTLELVMTGAEVCDPAVINLWKSSFPAARVVNAYGPTEATIVCVCHEIDNVDGSRTKAYPIGKPLSGVRVCRYDDCGNLEFVGRVDSQIKLAGRRVDLREIEAAARSALPCANVIAGVVRSPNGDSRLALISDRGDEHALELLRKAMSERLPSYMVPAVLASADGRVEDYRGATGKTDTKGLFESLTEAWRIWGATKYRLHEGGAFRPHEFS